MFVAGIWTIVWNNSRQESLNLNTKVKYLEGPGQTVRQRPGTYYRRP
jgi:hypothetical protein